VRPGFEGGQTPMYKAQRKFGFSNAQFRVAYAPLNVGRLQFFVDNGRIDASQPVTMRTLVDAGVLKRNAVLPHGVKLLASGADTLLQPLTIEVADASDAAVAAVEQSGGKVFKVYFNKLGLRVHLGLYKHFDRPLPRYSALPPAMLADGRVHPTETPSYLADPDHERHDLHIRFGNALKEQREDLLLQQQQQPQQQQQQQQPEQQ
jgi:ribosomal protein L15